MAMNNRGLGRGIQALFEGGVNFDSASGTADPSPLKNVAIETVHANPDQPRKSFDATNLQELADSIAQHGILQPLLVRPGAAPDEWQLLAGERRLRAAKLAGLSEVPVLVRELSDTEALIVTLLENLQREDLNAIDEALGLNALKEAMQATVEELAATLGQPRSTVSNSLRLLNLPSEIQGDIVEKRLTASHAKALAGMGDKDAMLELRNHILGDNMTTRQTLEAIDFWNANGRFEWQKTVSNAPLTENRKPRTAPALAKLGNALGETLRCKARINGNEQKGRISLNYDSCEQLMDLLTRLGLGSIPEEASMLVSSPDDPEDSQQDLSGCARSQAE